MNITTCAECRFFEAWSPQQASDMGGIMGNCKARAPKSYQIAGRNGEPKIMTKFAAVSSISGACGEGRPARPEVAPETATVVAVIAPAEPARRFALFRGLANRWRGERPAGR